MAKKIYGSVNGARKEVTAIYGPVNGARKEVLKVYGSVNGARKLVWEKAAPNLYGRLTYYDITTAPASFDNEQGCTVTEVYAGSYQDFIVELQQWYSGSYPLDTSRAVTCNVQAYGVVGQEVPSWTYIQFTGYNTQGTQVYIDMPTRSYASMSSYLTIVATANGNLTFDCWLTGHETVDRTKTHVYTYDSDSAFQNCYTYYANRESCKIKINCDGGAAGTNITVLAVKEFQFGSLTTSIPNNFLRASTIEVIDFSNCASLTTIGTYFCANAIYNAASTITSGVYIPNTVTSIGDYFLYCSKFNQPITLSTAITSIGNFFLSGGYSTIGEFNQNITIPSGVTTIGNYFLAYNRTFNKAITLPSVLTTIGNDFLYDCQAFNKAISIPNSVTTIGSYFLYDCDAFNSAITFGSGIQSIGDNFMGYCTSFNQSFTLDTGGASRPGKTIGNNFMARCYSFNSDCTIKLCGTNYGSIGTGFMSYLRDFNGNLHTIAMQVGAKPGGSTPADAETFCALNNSCSAYTNGVATCCGWASGVIPNSTTSPYRNYSTSSCSGPSCKPCTKV